MRTLLFAVAILAVLVGQARAGGMLAEEAGAPSVGWTGNRNSSGPPQAGTTSAAIASSVPVGERRVIGRILGAVEWDRGGGARFVVVMAGQAMDVGQSLR